MNLKILFVILVYYSVLSATFVLGGDAMFNDYDVNISLNDSELSSSEIDEGGAFTGGISFSRFFTLVTFGIGLPDSTPSWFTFLFALFQSLITILSIGFIIDSIWSG